MLHRSVRLPANAAEAAITATYDKGILEVTVPLTAPEASAGRQIEIIGK
jgi:HSP20 family protein